MGFWKAVGKLWPDTDQQRCWVHKTANVLEKLPKAMQPKVKGALHAIWQAETREQAYKAFDHCLERFEPKYPKAMACLAKQLAEGISGVKFVNGIKQTGDLQQDAA